MLSPTEIRERYERVQAQVGAGVTVVAATKYVSLDEMGALADAGIEVVGENRVQDLEAKHATYGSAFRWHFIGRLQSNKVKVVNGLCELVHSLDSHSAAERLEVPALLQVNLAGEATKGGVPPDEVADYLRYGIRGLSTMPPAAADPEASRDWFRRLRALAAEHGLAELSMGTTQDYRIAAEEGATMSGRERALPGDCACPPSGGLCPCVRLEAASERRICLRPWLAEVPMGDLWSRTLVYFGIAEEDDEFYEDDESSAAEESMEQSYRDRPNVRRLTPRRRTQEFDDWTESSETERCPFASPAAAPVRGRSGARPNAVRVHLVLPRSFNDAQQIADRFKQGIPVILNLQSADPELSKRLIDFASGLTYALNGGMQRVADKVFLLTPRNVEVSAEQRAQLLERGGFFNQA